MRKNNWIVAAIAAVACGVLLWAWFALGFNHVDDPLDLIVAIVWWLAVAAVVGGIVWAEGKSARRCAWPSSARERRVQPGGRARDARRREASWRRWAHAFPGMAFPTRWPRLTSACPRLPLGGAEPQSSTATARGLGGRGRRAHDRTPSRARSRPARTWPPCWRREPDT